MLLERVTTSMLNNGLKSFDAGGAIPFPVVTVADTIGVPGTDLLRHLLTKVLLDRRYAGAVVLTLEDQDPAAVRAWCAPAFAAAGQARAVDPEAGQDAAAPLPALSLAERLVVASPASLPVPSSGDGDALLSLFAPRDLSVNGVMRAVQRAGKQFAGAGAPWCLFVLSLSAIATCGDPSWAAAPHSADVATASAAPSALPHFLRMLQRGAAGAQLPGFACAVCSLHADALSDGAEGSAPGPAAADAVFAVSSTVLFALPPPAVGAWTGAVRVLHHKSTGGRVSAGLEALRPHARDAGRLAGHAYPLAGGAAEAAVAAGKDGNGGDTGAAFTQGLSFSLSLTARQRIAKAGVELPYHTDAAADMERTARAEAAVGAAVAIANARNDAAMASGGVLMQSQALAQALHAARAAQHGAAEDDDDGDMIIDDFDDEDEEI